jgi:hypothetical protein
MLGALLLQSVRDAWLRGADSVRFRGYCIDCRRIDGDDGGHPRMVLTLRVAGGIGMLDRLFIAVAPYPISGTRCDIRLQPVCHLPLRRTESPVGCVSPFDVRNASPETGHFSCKPASRKAWRLCQCFNPVGEFPPRTGGGLPIFYPCVSCFLGGHHVHAITSQQPAVVLQPAC